MQTLNISDPTIKLAVNGDEKRIIAFDPTDLLFAEKFYHLIEEFNTKLSEYKDRMVEIESANEVDEYNLPKNTPERIELVKETCVYLKGRIDYLFGEGTSQTAFGSMMNLNMFEQFFKGVTPYINSARADKVDKYVTKRPKRVRK